MRGTGWLLGLGERAPGGSRLAGHNAAVVCGVTPFEGTESNRPPGRVNRPAGASDSWQLWAGWVQLVVEAVRFGGWVRVGRPGGVRRCAAWRGGTARGRA
ncbi:hypothetical protein GCM10010347_37830 [Streptomyces cirratus]|uniref:Uncharacterized protein n=1 Tax=Streptomyces cirratus TaxID=68187 RepID=A0ABQ3EUS3_9ACTN|nr:hypothetical protein GCM10010347_37830 [Streptomyces cirratus]